MSAEMKLYLELKKHLKKQGWTILGGQPPSGSDHLPVIEIKLNHGLVKGSRDSYKPDLLAARKEFVAIFEIKPRFSQADFDKLTSILDSPQRLQALWRELAERNISGPDGNPISNSQQYSQVICALAYQTPFVRVARVWTFLFNNGTFEEHPPQ